MALLTPGPFDPSIDIAYSFSTTKYFRVVEKEYAIVYSYDPIGTNGTIRFVQIRSGEQARQKIVLVLEYQSLKLAKIKCG